MKDLCSSLIGFKQIDSFTKKIFETREEADYTRCQFKFKKDNSTWRKKKIKVLCLDLINFKEVEN